MAMVTAGLLVAGCSGNDDEADSASSPEASQEQQADPGQMPQSAPQPLSSSDIDDEQLQTAARIAVSVQMSTRQDRMQMQKEMRKKYGNPQQMDSTEKARAQKEMRRRQMEMQKKQMKIIREEAQNVGMDPQTFRQIMRSARQDSTLQKRLQAAMKTQMKEKMRQGAGQQNQ